MRISIASLIILLLIVTNGQRTLQLLGQLIGTGLYGSFRSVDGPLYIFLIIDNLDFLGALLDALQLIVAIDIVSISKLFRPMIRVALPWAPSTVGVTVAVGVIQSTSLASLSLGLFGRFVFFAFFWLGLEDERAKL